MKHRRLVNRAVIAAGLALIVAAGGFELWALVWEHHSQAAGRALVHQVQAAQRRNEAAGTRRGSPATACSTRSAKSVSSPQGVLLAPSIGLVAPVLQGTGNAQLDVAVGHDPSSVWPGATGNAVLLAHDVSYFVHIDSLRPGQVVRYETACRSYSFVVASHAIVKAGTPVFDTSQPSLTLVTCWPTNALWFTPDRYLVTLVASGAAPVRTAAAAAPRSVPLFRVPAPTGLVDQGLTLATNSIWMGTLTETGSPSRSWSQSPGPLLAEGSALEAYVGGLKSLGSGRLGWWRDLAPSIAPPAPLAPTALAPGAPALDYLSPLEITVDAAGASLHSIELTSEVRVSAGPRPGTYRLDVLASVVGSRLLLTRWTMTPA